MILFFLPEVETNGASNFVRKKEVGNQESPNFCKFESSRKFCFEVVKIGIENNDLVR